MLLWSVLKVVVPGFKYETSDQSAYNLNLCWQKMFDKNICVCHLRWRFSNSLLPQLQQFNYTWLRLIKHEEWCLAPAPDQGALRLLPCDNRNQGLKWLHKSTSAFHSELVSEIFVSLLYKPNFPLHVTESPHWQLTQPEDFSAFVTTEAVKKFLQRDSLSFL